MIRLITIKKLVTIQADKPCRSTSDNTRITQTLLGSTREPSLKGLNIQGILKEEDQLAKEEAPWAKALS